jgi:hypothetical protein
LLFESASSYLFQGSGDSRWCSFKTVSRTDDAALSVTASVLSPTTLIRHQRCLKHCWYDNSAVWNTADTISIVSQTPLILFFGYLHEFETEFEKYVSGTNVWLTKKNRGRKSHATISWKGRSRIPQHVYIYTIVHKESSLKAFIKSLVEASLYTGLDNITVPLT